MSLTLAASQNKAEGEGSEEEENCDVLFRKVQLQALDMDWLFQD